MPRVMMRRNAGPGTHNEPPIIRCFQDKWPRRRNVFASIESPRRARTSDLRINSRANRLISNNREQYKAMESVCYCFQLPSVSPEFFLSVSRQCPTPVEGGRALDPQQWLGQNLCRIFIF